MYHFTADHPPEPVRLSFRSLISGHMRQYLKNFQLDAIRFMHSFLAKNEFCVYNDESGLGKQAAVAVLLDAVCNSHKCLIVVQNDDRYVNGWEFHFNVLANTRVLVIKDEKDYTDSSQNIYVAKWSTLRTIDDLSKFKFDFIILDNRGQMLNNSFCTSMLLKHYERKIKILISSVDVTSDLKLLHNVLRLGGRLDPQYSSFKVFEDKFKLPDAKELAYKRVDLEEYFCKRERLADYCKAFRLRRYCHQYETQLPMVTEDRYKINLDLWREKQNTINSEMSSIDYVDQKNREDEHIRDTQELFEEYCRKRRKQHLQFQHEEEQRLKQRKRDIQRSLEADKEIMCNVDDEVASINDTPPTITKKQGIVRDNSDEPVLMSPLLVESDSDADDVPEIFNDSTAQIEIVDLSSEGKEEEHDKQNEDNNANIDNIKEVDKCKIAISNKNVKRKPFKKRSELDRLAEDIVDTLKINNASTRLSRNAKQIGNSNKRLNNKLKEKIVYSVVSESTCLNEKATRSSTNTSNGKLSLKSKCKSTGKIASKSYFVKKCREIRKDSSVKTPEISEKENSTQTKYAKVLNNGNASMLSLENSISSLNSMEKIKKTLKNNTNTKETTNITIPSTSRKTRSVHNVENTSIKTPAEVNNNQVIKQEILEGTIQGRKVNSKDFEGKVNSEKIRLKREMEISPAGVHHKQTRSMQRLTRSAGGSKYLTRNLSLQIEKISKPKKKSAFKKTPKTIKENKNIELDNKNKNKKVVEDTTKNDIKNTQTSIISHRSTQDYESLQCAQRLSDVDVFGIEKTAEFLVPSTPNAIVKNSLIPFSLTSSAGFFAESELVFMPSSNLNSTTANPKRDHIILLSSSDNENSTSQSSSTNVSMTSRRTRALKPKRNQQEAVSVASKVPNLSDFLTQQNTCSCAKSPDLFSNCSDFNQVPCTQRNLNSEGPNTPFEGFKIFGSEVKQLQQHFAFNQNNNTYKQDPNRKKSYRNQRSCLDILEKMFEPPNKKPKQLTDDKSSTSTKKSIRRVAAPNKQKTHTQILPFHPTEAITEARQQQEAQKQRLSTMASSSRLLDDDIFEITNNGTFGSVMRLHSNGDISPVQHTLKTNATQHNKITNYLIGNAAHNDYQVETTPNSGNSTVNINTEAGTPSKRNQQSVSVQNVNVKKSPKGKSNLTQATKLTKWFTKPSQLRSNDNAVKTKTSYSKKTPTNQVQTNQEVDLTITTSASPPTSGTRIFKRRRLDLSFNK